MAAVGQKRARDEILRVRCEHYTLTSAQSDQQERLCHQDEVKVKLQQTKGQVNSASVRPLGEVMARMSAVSCGFTLGDSRLHDAGV